MRISVVTAAWNSGATLRDTIESVLAQDYADFEHVIVDGGSSDDSIDIIRAYEPAYHGRLKWISEKDRGIYDAMNKGIRMATGDVVGILNSDDFFSSKSILTEVARAMKADRSVMAVYGDVHYVNDCDLSKCVRYYSSRSFRRWQMRFGFMPAHPSFYCRREVYERFGLYNIDFRSAADFECLLRLLFCQRVPTRYLALDFVTMRTGGMSSSGWKSYSTTASETVRACRLNHVYSNRFFLMLKLVWKGVQLSFQKIFHSK